MHNFSYERCVALLHQLVAPLPLHARSAALTHLQSRVSSRLMSFLGAGMERVLESERACQVCAATAGWMRVEHVQDWRCLPAGSQFGRGGAAVCLQPGGHWLAWLGCSFE